MLDLRMSSAKSENSYVGSAPASQMIIRGSLRRMSSYPPRFSKKPPSDRCQKRSHGPG